MIIFRCFNRGLVSLKRLTIIFVLVSLVVVYFSVLKLHAQSQRLEEVLQLLKYSKERSEVLQKFLKKLLDDQKNSVPQDFIIYRYNRKHHGDDGGASRAPSPEYEELRRRIQNNIVHMSTFLNNQVGRIQEEISYCKNEHVTKALMSGAEYKRSLLIDMNDMRTTDGYETWRQHETKKLSDLVQLRLRYLQNPKDCNKARLLICRLVIDECGFGCQLTHIVHCLIAAYATERTMIVKPRGWLYSKYSLEEDFLPFSETCRDVELGESTEWPGNNDTRTVSLYSYFIRPIALFSPQAIPEDLAPQLKMLHGYPFVWWFGQLLKYIVKPQPSTQKLYESGAAKLGWQTPIVGIHVRHTDKFPEAYFYELEDYMIHVEDYFLTQEMNGTKIPRRVFIATDDVNIFDEARVRYPQYEFLGNPEAARLADRPTRFSKEAFNDVLLDVHLLSLCDFVVCTFTSNICRVAYGLMQILHTDATHRVISIDEIFNLMGQQTHVQEAIIAHEPYRPDELQLKPGDLIAVHPNQYFTGFSQGENYRTYTFGRYPAFKVKDKVEMAKMPSYPLTA